MTPAIPNPFRVWSRKQTEQAVTGRIGSGRMSFCPAIFTQLSPILCSIILCSIILGPIIHRPMLCAYFAQSHAGPCRHRGCHWQVLARHADPVL